MRGFSTAAAAATATATATATAGVAASVPKVISFTLLPNLALFWHINHGVEEILADYVHQEITRNLIVIYLRLFLLIVAKDVFLSLVY